MMLWLGTTKAMLTEVETRLEKVLRKEDPKLWKAVEENIQWNKRKK